MPPPNIGISAELVMEDVGDMRNPSSSFKSSLKLLFRNFTEVERNPWLDAGRHDRVKSFGKRNIIAGSMDKVTAMVNNNAVAQPMPIV